MQFLQKASHKNSLFLNIFTSEILSLEYFLKSNLQEWRRKTVGFVLVGRKFSFPLYLSSSNLQQDDSLKTLTELLLLFGSNSNNKAQCTHPRHAKLGILLNEGIKFKLKDTRTHVASHIRIHEQHLSAFPNVLNLGIHLLHFVQTY